MMQPHTNIYLMKDLSRLSGHSVHTLKFYLRLGLIQERGRSPGTRFRYFDDSTLAQLSEIRAWRKEQKSLSEISHLLNASESSRLKAQGSRQEPLPSASSLQPSAPSSA